MLSLFSRIEKWNENAVESRSRMKSEMKMPWDREVKCQQNSREFSRNKILAGYWPPLPLVLGKVISFFECFLYVPEADYSSMVGQWWQLWAGVARRRQGYHALGKSELSLTSNFIKQGRRYWVVLTGYSLSYDKGGYQKTENRPKGFHWQNVPKKENFDENWAFAQNTSF